MTLTFLVTGCAGFIGSNLVDRLLANGHRVVGVDNFSTGQRRFLSKALSHSNFKLIEMDVLDLDSLKAAFVGGDAVFHLSANADVRFGTSHPRRDLEQNTIGTYNVLEAMRANGIKKIAFSTCICPIQGCHWQQRLPVSIHLPGAGVLRCANSPGLHGEDLLLADRPMILNTEFNEHVSDPPTRSILPVSGPFAQGVCGKAL